MDNQFTSNVKNAWDNVGSGTLNVTHNYWGATPPALQLPQVQRLFPTLTLWALLLPPAFLQPVFQE